MIAPLLNEFLVDARTAELARIAPQLEQRREYHELQRVARLEAALRVARERLHPHTVALSRAR